MNNAFTESEKTAVYRAIHERRDVRAQFLPDPIPDTVLKRLLAAAHAAPSVGFMQPWDFIIIDDLEIRQRIKTNFDTENAKAATNYTEQQADLYRQLKLEGILESPINICITCDRQLGGEHVLGRNSIVERDLFSSCLAVQNFWLAARAEGLGVGWVSILDNQLLSQVLNLPAHVYPLAYLCVGYVSAFLEQPELAQKGWRQRLQLNQLVHYNRW